MKRFLWWIRLNLMLLGASYSVAALTTPRLDYAYRLNQQVALLFVVASAISGVALAIIWVYRKEQRKLPELQ